MKILVTGANGFVGKNLCVSLPEHKILKFDVDTKLLLLDEYCHEAEFVFHLAGVNRPKDPSEFASGNVGFTTILLDSLKKSNNKCPIVLSSSAQAALNNPYGISKRSGEELIRAYGNETGANVTIYRFPNIFGKWCRPNYNSAVATFCHNIARNLPITIYDQTTELTLVYIDDLIEEFKRVLAGNLAEDEIVTHRAELGYIVQLIKGFRNNRNELTVPELSDPFIKKLHATYLSYLPVSEFSYPLKMNLDNRGSFTEILRTNHHGQFSVNITKPGVVKGNHWHNTKSEKFLVVGGEGLIRLRRMDSMDSKIIEHRVCGEKMEVVDIPPGYTHNIKNIGENDLITFMWCNEPFNPEKPDTVYLEV